MDRWARFVDWCQRPSKIKVRSFNPRNVVVLATISIILASITTFGTWSLAVVPNVPEYTFVNPESIRTLTITKNTTLTEDHFGNIVIAAEGVTFDGAGHSIIGPSPGIYIMDPNIKYGVTIGILLEGRTGVTIKNCHVTGFGCGIYLYHSNESTLQGNTANNNAGGFSLAECEGNIVQGNTANNNSWTGFDLSASSNNVLLNNTANNIIEGTGFALGISFDNTLQGNTANGNSDGFSLEECDGNIFEANTAETNTKHGFNLWGSSNIFFHNNLIGNAIQVVVGGANTWDDGYPSGGNYWSDYQGVDMSGDGIGDTPHVIDDNNMDNFPLMAPISMFDDGIEGGEIN